MPTCYLGLGGNAGDVVEAMQRGLALLDEMPGVHVGEVSPVYETAPVGAAAGSVYLNAAARLECACSPLMLLEAMQSIEDRLGRVRAERWSTRPLDLDLLLFGEMIFAEPVLTVPHPQLWYRRFVLDPLADIAAEVVHPALGVRIRDLRARLLARPLGVLVTGGDAGERAALAGHLNRGHADARVRSETAQAWRAGDPAIVLELTGGTANTAERRNVFTVRELIESARGRVVHLAHLPGTRLEAGDAVLTAALDEPVPHSRPLRRMP